MAGVHGDGDRDAVPAVSSRPLGRRLAEAVQEISGLRWNAAAHGVRWFGKGVERTRAKAHVVVALKVTMSHVQI